MGGAVQVPPGRRYRLPMPNRSTSRDVRAQRSRASLTAAAMDLLRTHSPSDITAAQISSAAGVSRQTFYQHFTDALDAIAAAITGAMDETLHRAPGDAPLARLLRFAVDNVSFYDKLRTSDLSARLQQHILMLLAPTVAELVGEDDETSPRVAFLVGGVLQLIVTWSARPAAFDLEAVVLDQLQRVEPSAFARTP